jgi:hypothetical protein
MTPIDIVWINTLNKFIMASNLIKAIEFVNNNNLIGIKAGKDRATFLDIWMVIVDNRIFARSWGFAEKSWYNNFKVDNEGELKCGENILKIKAVIPADLIEISAKINNAYLAKYNFGANAKYAIGIIQKEHILKTMEFVVNI